MPKTKTNNKKKGNTRKKTNNMKKGKTIKSTRKTKQVPKDEAVVLIHANWCPHCQTMKPEWNEMKNKLGSIIETIEIEDSDSDKDIKIMDIENNRLQNERVEIAGYPTIFKIKNGHAVYYGGNRTLDDMYAWVTEKSGGYNKSKIRSSNKSKYRIKSSKLK